MRRLFHGLAAALGATLMSDAAVALSIDLSTANGAAIGGLSLSNGSVATYDDVAGTASLRFDEARFAANENVDALHVLDDGRLLLSTSFDSNLGGLSLRAGDVALYDPATDSASLFFDESLMSGDANVDAVFLAADGTLVLSTRGNSTLAGLSFGDGDLVVWNPVTASASLLFDEALFVDNEDVDAVHVLPDGRIALSTTADAQLGGLSFGDGDVVVYDPVTDTATLLLSEAAFAGDEDVDALFIPEAGTLLPWLSSAVALGRRRRAVQPVT